MTVDLDQWVKAADWVRNLPANHYLRFVKADPDEVDALVAELRAAREVIPEARRVADQLVEDAKATAKAMVAEAEARARGIVEAALERAFEITQETTNG